MWGWGVEGGRDGKQDGGLEDEIDLSRQAGKTPQCTNRQLKNGGGQRGREVGAGVDADFCAGKWLESGVGRQVRRQVRGINGG